jgi:uncharacterized phage protein gp47/JayE
MITALGFQRPSFEEILAEVQANAISKFDDGGENTPSVEPEDWLGANTYIIAEAKNDLYKIAEDTYYAIFLSTATGVSLDRAAVPTQRIAEKKAIATVELTGTAATVVPAGFLFERDDGTQYALSNAQVLSGGVDEAQVQAVIGGIAGNAPVGAIKFIPVPLDGLDSVVSITPASGGAPVETDSSLRARARIDRSIDRTSSLQAIVNRVLEVADVLDAVGFENTDTVPVAGRPGSSFEIVVNGGTDEDMAQAIFGSKPAGIESFGSTTVPVTDPTNGQVFDISFSRVVQVSISFTVTLTTNDDYDPVAAEPIIRQAILDYTGGVNPLAVESPGVAIGEAVYAWKAEASLFEPDGSFSIAGIEEVLITLDKTPNGPPYLLRKVVIDDTDQAFTDFSLIDIVEV